MRGANALGNIGSAVTWPWPLFVALSFATTCTQGDDDSWGVTLLFCTCIALVALPFLAVSARRGARSWIRLSVPVVTLGPLALLLGHAFETGFGAHHLCGPEYDSTLEYASSLWRARWYYPSMWGLASVLSAAAVWPWLRQKRGRGASKRSPAPGAV